LKQTNAEFEKCMSFKFGLDIVAAAKRLGKQIDDDAFITSFIEKIGNQ
jgi:hypothetical protein